MNRKQTIHFPRWTWLAALFAIFICVSAQAHEASKSYLSLRFESGRFTGRLEIPLVEIGNVVPGQGTRYDGVADYVRAHLRFVMDGRDVVPEFTSQAPELEELSGGRYLEFKFALAQSAVPRTLEVGYRLFFETNTLHRGLLRLEACGRTQMAAFSPEHPAQKFQFDEPSYGAQFLAFVREGVWHIWTGYDHILFLLALLLPAVLRREGGEWRAVNDLRPAFYNVLKIVSAFTVAHSLTLSIAALGIVKLPSRITESAIAISVVLAAANNLWPLVRERGWMVAFGFGLIHGFGFATALSEFGPGRGNLALTLAGFNCGVEIGQLAIVAVFLPAAFALRRTWLYQIPVLRLGSAFVIILAGAWCAERMLDVKFVPF